MDGRVGEAATGLVRYVMLCTSGSGGGIGRSALCGKVRPSILPCLT